MSAFSASSITFDYINNTVNRAVTTKEGNLMNVVTDMGDAPTTQDLLMLQQQVTQWTMFTQVQSTLVKEVGDAMKGVIQKAG